MKVYGGQSPRYQGCTGIVFRGKGDDSCWQELEQEFVARSWANGRKMGPIILREKTGSERIDRYLIYSVVNGAGPGIGAPHITPRGIEAARTLAGHSDRTTTQRYSRWDRYQIRGGGEVD